MEIRNDISNNTYNAGYTGYETPKVSGNSDAPPVAEAPKAESAAAAAQPVKMPTYYETQQQKMTLEADLDRLIAQIMPDRGVQFKIHENTGSIITSVIDRNTKEVIREFPAEKILDMIHNMCSKMGMIVNKKV